MVIHIPDTLYYSKEYVLLSLCEYIGSNGFLVHPEFSDARSLFASMLPSLEGKCRMEDSAEILDALMSREELASTAIGHECAVPHVHSDLVSETGVVIAVLDRSLDFDKELPVRIVFLLAGPVGETDVHLQLLSRVCQFLNDDEFRAQMIACATPGELRELIEKRDAR